MSAVSTPGKGTTIRVELDLLEVEVIADTGTRRCDAPSPRGTERIMIAEDDEMVLDMATALLEGAGYSVLSVRDGEEAVRRFEEFADEISLVILDLMLPKLSGLEAHKRIRSMRSDVRVLFCSGYSSEMQAYTEAIEKGTIEDGIPRIQKPYDPKSFLTRVRELIDTAPPRES